MIRNYHWPVILGMAVLLLSGAIQAGEFETSFRKEASLFINSLNKEQSKSCLYAIDDERRWRMHYPGGKRPGIMISSLNADQRKGLEKTLRLVLSPHGWKMANEVAKQDAKGGEDPLGKYWVTCFGDPRKGNFAFRLAEHHLTIVHLEVNQGETKEFGPILLGANPPSLWKADEKALMAAWKKMDNRDSKDSEKALLKGKQAIASKPMPAGEGVLFTELDAKAQAAIKAAWQLRLSVFTKPIRTRINKLHADRGGWGKLHVSFYNEAPVKRCIDGGRWDFKCGLPGMVWDFESSRGHIHMSLWVKDDSQKAK